MLWRYHLHYFDDLNALDFPTRGAWHQALIERWIAENPPGGGAGWDSYPTSLRVVNWVKWWLGGAPASSNALQSVQLQLAWIASRLEYHLLGNHLLENARALIFGGLFFDGDAANRWLHRGFNILSRQLPEQILEDGGHFERSPMYHQIVLTGLLDLYNLLQVFDRAERSDLSPYLQRMLRWSRLMRHPDDDIALFNDAALHEAPAAGRLEQYAAHLGLAALANETPAAQAAGVHLRASGYVRVARAAYTALLNVGSVAPAYQPGHAHADTLSFELSALGSRLIVDTGTSTYEQGRRRDWERGSAAHNTIVLNGLNSSDVWGGFRVARRARVIAAHVKTDSTITRVTAAHDGYRHLPARAVHQRHWEFAADHVRIEDFIDGRGAVDVDLNLNVHPDFQLTQTSSTGFMARDMDGTAVAIIDMPPELSGRVAVFSYAPRFGVVREGTRIIASASLRLPQTLTTLLRFAAVARPMDAL